ncbi:MAG: LysR substrate-binding domain-containing protein [Paracraurococcus sp.]|jgi:LysR family transcriptional regulator, glycine cleavage system transcriptional activator
MPPRASPHALRAFVEVARYGGVAPAARVLGTSPSAVSHLLRELETALAVVLFQPASRRTVLTEAGERLRAGLGDAFDIIDRAVAELHRSSGEVRVSTLSSFATLWLVPRLAKLQASHPGLRVLIATGTRVVDLAAEPFDCAIRWGRGGWPGLVELPLLRERLIAVCGPMLLAGRLPVATEAEFLALPRLAARSRPQDWPRLLAAAGWEPRRAAAPALAFETRALAVRAAIAGLGIAVVDRSLVRDALRDGHLVQALPVSVARPEAHILVARPQALRDRSLRAFRDWLAAEAAAEESEDAPP